LLWMFWKDPYFVASIVALNGLQGSSLWTCC
jgi:hypothetical protein